MAYLVVGAWDVVFFFFGVFLLYIKSDDESKIPFLGDLPGIGRLFRSTAQESKKSELLILLRTTVLVGKKVDEIAARELDRLKRVRGSSPW